MVVVLAAAVGPTTPVAAQTALNWSADDGARIEVLQRTGDHIEGTHLVLWFPPSLARPDAEALVKRLDPAVAGAGAAAVPGDRYYLSARVVGAAAVSGRGRRAPSPGP